MIGFVKGKMIEEKRKIKEIKIELPDNKKWRRRENKKRWKIGRTWWQRWKLGTYIRE